MESIDAKVFTLVAAGTTTLVGILKKLFPKWVDGKEEGLSQLFPILFTVAAKLGGLFQATEWVDALLFAVGGGLVAGVIHDKAVDPAKKLLKAVFGGKNELAASVSPTEEKEEEPK